jgi:ABC-2 type transport system ATP-binding protein
VSAPDLMALTEELAAAPGVDLVAPFGATLHIGGRDPAALQRLVASLATRPGVACRLSEPSLEDVFISLMGRTRDNYK